MRSRHLPEQLPRTGYSMLSLIVMRPTKQLHSSYHGHRLCWRLIAASAHAHMLPTCQHRCSHRSGSWT